MQFPEGLEDSPFKRKVLKYPINCRLHATLILNLAKNLMYVYGNVWLHMYEYVWKLPKERERKKEEEKTFRCPWWPYECIFFLLLKKEASILE